MVIELERIEENVLTHEIRFVDSMKFMASSLERLVGNLEKDQLIEMKRIFGDKADLLSRKGVYPYDFMESFEKFGENLPEKSDFFSKLYNCGISDKDYEHACHVWKEFEMKNMEEYHDLYLKTDVLLLADVFENFRKVCQKRYESDPAHYYTTPGLTWDAMLKLTEVELELLNDLNMLQMIERGMRGGNSNAFCRFSQANNKYVKDFDESQPSKFIITYLDANNLYGWAMSKGLPVGGFRWLDWNEAVEWERTVETEGVGYFLEVDLEYPEEMHDEHNDFPLAPESLVLNKFPKLTQNLMEKSEWFCMEKT